MTQEEKDKRNQYMRMYRAKNKKKFQEMNKKYRTGESREKYLESKKNLIIITSQKSDVNRRNIT